MHLGIPFAVEHWVAYAKRRNLSLSITAQVSAVCALHSGGIRSYNKALEVGWLQASLDHLQMLCNEKLLVEDPLSLECFTVISVYSNLTMNARRKSVFKDRAEEDRVLQIIQEELIFDEWQPKLMWYPNYRPKYY